MKTKTKEDVKAAFNEINGEFWYASVVYGKGKDRRWKGFLLHSTKLEKSIERLTVFLSEKSLTHNLSSISGVNGWGRAPSRVEIRLVESKDHQTNIDADMIEAIVRGVRELPDKSIDYVIKEALSDDGTPYYEDREETGESGVCVDDVFEELGEMDLGMP